MSVLHAGPVHAPTVLQVDLSAIALNYRYLKKLASGAGVAAVEDVVYAGTVSRD